VVFSRAALAISNPKREQSDWQDGSLSQPAFPFLLVMISRPRPGATKGHPIAGIPCFCGRAVLCPSCGRVCPLCRRPHGIASGCYAAMLAVSVP
jgi:hypothetical protein